METPITLPGSGEPLRTELADFTSSSQLTGGGLGALTQADFLRLLTTQLANQDPLEPVSNEEMLSQMAQFSSLEAETRTTQTLEDIALKLDAMLEAQAAAREAEAGGGAEGEDALSPYEQATLDTLALIAAQLGTLTQLQQATLEAATAPPDATDDVADDAAQGPASEDLEEPAAVLPAPEPVA